MSNTWRMIVIVVLAIAVVAVLSQKTQKTQESKSREVKASNNACPACSPKATKPEPIAPEKNPSSTPAPAQDKAKASTASVKLSGSAVGAKPESSKATPLPRIVDLGATKCLTCQMMTTVLDELKREKKGKLEVVFIDVWENKEAASKYKIQSIPTQILYDKNGKEFLRHEGFFAKKDILAKFAENGVQL